VGKHQILEGKFARMKGPFDRDYIQCPLARVYLRSPWFGCNSDVLVEVALTDLNDGLQCIVGNRIFSDHPELKDMLTLRPGLNFDTELMDFDRLNNDQTSPVQNTTGDSSNNSMDISPEVTRGHYMTDAAADHPAAQQPAVSDALPSEHVSTNATYGHNDLDRQNSLSHDHGQVIDSVQMVRTRAAAETEGRETETDTETDDDGRMTDDAELEVTSDPLTAEYRRQSNIDITDTDETRTGGNTAHE